MQRHQLALWALQTASTRGDTKIKVGENSKVNTFKFSSFWAFVFIFASVYVCVFQWWMKWTMSSWWWSQLTNPRHPPGSSVWSDRQAPKCHLPLTQTRSRWSHGSTQKASQNRKSCMQAHTPSTCCVCWPPLGVALMCATGSCHSMVAQQSKVQTVHDCTVNNKEWQCQLVLLISLFIPCHTKKKKKERNYEHLYALSISIVSHNW